MRRYGNDDNFDANGNGHNYDVIILVVDVFIDGGDDIIVMMIVMI